MDATDANFYLALIFFILVAIAAILGWIALQINNCLGEKDRIREGSTAEKKRDSRT